MNACESSRGEYLETGDLILLLAQGTDASWSPDSPVYMDPNPPLGYLSAQAYYDNLDAEGYCVCNQNDCFNLMLK